MLSTKTNLRNTTALAALLALTVATPAHAAPGATNTALEQRIQKLEQELNDLKQQATQPASTPQDKPADKSAAVELNSSGLTITSNDQNFQLKVRGYAQADARTFVGSNHASNTDQFLIRTARPVIDANFYKQVSGRLMLDFGNGQTSLVDAYADYKPDTAINVRLGKFKAPIGLERNLPEPNLLFAERGLANDLVPFRDIGAQLYGSALKDQLDYQLAVTNGAGDLVNPNGDADSSKDLTGRIFTRPFRQADIAAIKEIGFGIAGSTGEHKGSTTNTNVTAGYVTPGQVKFFTYRSDVFANGTTWRLNPQVNYLYGPFSALGEYIKTSQALQRGSSIRTFTNDGWTAETSYVLTGEDARFDGVRPRENFDPSKGNWGAFEVAGRVSALSVDKDTFTSFADPTVSARHARDLTGGVNWYWNPNVKINADYSYTVFDGGNTAGRDRASEKLLLTRLQVGF